VIADEEERFVENHHNVMDVIASWIPLKAKNKKIKTCKLYFAISANMAYLENREFVTKIQFHAFALNLKRGKVVMSNEDMAKYAAIHIAADIGKVPDYEAQVE
jgi:hypothetical protein